MAAGLHTLKSLDDTLAVSGQRQPVIFIGHGSPMNALADNSFTRTLQRLGTTLPRPEAILVVSAHWMTRGTWVTAMAQPKTIHDFYGFPKALFDVQYPAPGSPEFAELVKQTAQAPVQEDPQEWGLDHGTWSVLRHMYPQADIPVLQLSLNMSEGPDFHLRLGEELRPLRNKGVLILGSGNLVHNLRKIRWEEQAPAFEWASEFDQWIKARLEKRDAKSILHGFADTEAGRLSVPTQDHYLPLHYILGASDHQDELRFEYEEIQNGSISMRSLSFGNFA